LQVVSVSAAGPAFVYRVNTTLPYCGYEQTNADLASSGTANPTATATAITAAVTIAGSVSFSGSLPYDVAVFGPTNGAAATMFVPNSSLGTVGIYSLATPASPLLLSTITGLSTPIGLVVDSTGYYLYVASSAASIIYQCQINSASVIGRVGNAAGVLLPDGLTQAGTGALADPRYVALDSTGDLFITDTGTQGFADVMEFYSPIPIGAAASVTYWGGSLSNSASTTCVGQVATAGTTVIVANSINDRIDFYSSTGSSVATSLSSDNNPAGAVNFINPQGVAYSLDTGLLYIADTGNNRIVEMYPSGTFVKILSGTSLGLSSSGPTGIKLDNATPPNIYIVDTGNGRVLMLQ